MQNAEFDGYKCAGCGKDFGVWIPEDGCSRCGCITAEKKRIPKNQESESRL